MLALPKRGRADPGSAGPLRRPPGGEALRASGGAHFATGMVNSAPLAMLSGQRCITLL